MRKVIENITKLPKWYGIIIVLMYGIFTAECSTFLCNYIKTSFSEISNIVDVILRFTYLINVLTAFAMWITGCLMFHITALLLGGKQEMLKFLYASAYPVVILIMATSMSILLLDNITLDCKPDEIEFFLQGNEYFQLSKYIVNISYLLYLLIIVVFVHYLYNLKWYNSVFAVFSPVGTIYGIIDIIHII